MRRSLSPTRIRIFNVRKPALFALGFAAVAAALYAITRSAPQGYAESDGAPQWEPGPVPPPDVPDMPPQDFPSEPVYDPLDPSARRSAAFFTPSQSVMDFVRSWEGFSSTPYNLGDGGLTIGYGEFFKPGDPNMPQHLSEPEARARFEAKISGAYAAQRVYDFITRPVNQYEFDALCSVAYNLTLASWKGFAGAVNNGADVPSLLAQYTYAKINGTLKQLPGLLRRRNGEAAIWASADYSRTA